MILRDFDIDFNIKRIMRILECDEENDLYQEIICLIDNLREDFFRNIDAKAIFEIKESKNSEYRYTVFSLATLGGKITDLQNLLFENGEYMSGLVINAMADDYIMNMDNLICKRIVEVCENMKIGITPKFIPFENIEPSAQKNICEELDSFRKIGVTFNKSYVLIPEKSFSFLCGADRSISEKNILHDCSKCNKSDCKWRNCL